MKHSAGFTLIELMFTLVLAAIIAVLAVPSFNTTIANNRMVTKVNEMVTSLTLGRSEAIKRASTVTVCKSTNGTSCATSGAWTQGWMVFVDANGDGVVDAGDIVLQVYQGSPGALTVNGDGAAGNRITFNSRGFVSTLPAVVSGVTLADATLTVCDSRGASEARGLIVNVSGRVARARDTNADGIEENASGTNLSCP